LLAIENVPLRRRHCGAGRRRRVTMHWTDLFNSVGSLFIVATASTKTMVPLRILAIVANCFLIVFYAVTHSWVPMVLQAAALPLNAWRLYQMIVLIRNVRGAIRGNSSMDWLKPFMTGRHFRKGDILFARGEPANEMFCTVTGRYRLLELGIELKPGQLVGELAMLAPDNRRTATLECIEDGEALSITYEQVEQLYYQNPTFGFYFLRLATARLFDNISRMESELTRIHAAQA
jgi:CRP/FNR family cyclic AMP-dependent transcriptional regulator